MGAFFILPFGTTLAIAISGQEKAAFLNKQTKERIREKEEPVAKQMMKGLTMAALAGVVLLVTAVVSANGQTVRHQVANIPFDFVVGNSELPAGSYMVQRVGDNGGGLRIDSTDKTKAVFRLSSPIVEIDPSETSKLVFHRYGNKYFLAEIWTAGENNGRKLMKSPNEKSLERELSTKRTQRNYDSVAITFIEQ